MAVREISIAEHWDAASALMAANWRETGDTFPFAPSREFWENAQASGMLVALGVFSLGLRGYAGVMFAPHPFNPDVLIASVNPLYVQPGFRNGILPGQLILAVQRLARERGAQRLYWHMRSGTPAAAMLERHGAVLVDSVLAQELDDGC